MNINEQWMDDFQRTLLVDEPKRSEILAELRQHAQAKALGEPKRIAREYNRTHIGFFSSNIRMLLVPAFFCAVLVVLNMLWNGITVLGTFFHLSLWGGYFSYSIIGIVVVAILVICTLVTHSLSRWQQPARILLVMVPVYLVSFYLFLWLVVTPTFTLTSNADGTTRNVLMHPVAFLTENYYVILMEEAYTAVPFFVILASITLVLRLFRQKRERSSHAQTPLAT